MAIDRGDSHYDDAGSWERACRHIGLFLWWAAERGLASEHHDPKKIRENPTEHFISQCDTKLYDEDMTEDGRAFAASEYGNYLGEVSAYARTLSVTDYEIPENDVTTKHFFDWLDARLAVIHAQRGD